MKRYPYFREQFQSALNEIAAIKPDAVVLIDYPGFNLRLARALRKKSPALKIIYYISPQVWAWNRGRIAQMARYPGLDALHLSVRSGALQQIRLADGLRRPPDDRESRRHSEPAKNAIRI